MKTGLFWKDFFSLLIDMNCRPKSQQQQEVVVVNNSLTPTSCSGYNLSIVLNNSLTLFVVEVIHSSELF